MDFIKKNIFKLITLLVSLMALVVCIDLSINYEFHVRSKDKMSEQEIRVLKLLYIYSRDRIIISYDPQCARYDKELFYTLKPGSCFHSGIEFKNFYQVNSIGTRDSENALNAPEIIFIGDSHTMGWGVDQNKIFSKLVEDKTGLKTLNMGIASYGTYKELKYLNRVNLKNVKYLIIQYNDNDYLENYSYLNNQLQIGNEKNWNSYNKAANPKVFLGSHFLDLLDMFYRLTINSQVIAPLIEKFSLEERYRSDYINKPTREHVENFNRVFDKILPPSLKNKKKIIFNVSNESHPEEYSFNRDFSTLLSKNNINQMLILDISQELNKQENRFFIDNHINEKGHKFIAAQIINLISEHKN